MSIYNRFSAILNCVAVVPVTNEVANNEKSGFSWWLVVVIAVVVLGIFRWIKLGKEGNDTKHIIYDLIPGGIIGTIVEKIHPSAPEVTSSAVAPDVDENGYLKKSNTAAIRPVYSNVPSNKSSVERKVATTPVQKAPIKRPKELSVNRAQTVQTEVEKRPAEVKPVKQVEPERLADTMEYAPKMVPSQKRPPVKRPTKALATPYQRPAEDLVEEKVNPEPKPAAPKVPVRKKEVSTMNRPDSDRLNENATSSAASVVFRRESSEEKEFAPAIATAILPPIQEKKERVSPFKPNPNAVKESPKPVVESTAPVTPAIARFTEIPLVEKPASPFKPISNNLDNE